MHWKGIILSVVVGGLLYLTLMSGTDHQQAWAAAARLTLPGWLFILGLSLANYCVRFLRWDAYLRHFGNRVPAFRHLLVYIGGFALTTTPAKAGEAVRALYLRPHGVRYGRSIAALYAERLVDVTAMALLAAALFLVPAPGYRWLAGLAAALAAALMVCQHPRLVAAMAALARRLPWRRPRSVLAHGIDCLRQAGELLRPRLLSLGVGLGVISWGAEAVALYWVAQELGLHLSMAGAVGIYATAMLAGALSFIPGGLGGTEAVMISLLVLTGAPPATAVAITTIIRVATLWFAVALGVLALAVLEASERREPVAADGHGVQEDP